MRLLLIRHANAQEFSTSGKDHDRALSGKGQKQCEKTKSVLSKLDVNLSEFISFSSTSKRTKETTNLLFNGSLSFSFRKNLYLASSSELMQFIWDLKTNKDLLILGHNNGLSQLASYFTGKSIFLKTGSFVTLHFPFDCSNELSIGLGEIVNSHRCDIDVGTFL